MCELCTYKDHGVSTPSYASVDQLLKVVKDMKLIKDIVDPQEVSNVVDFIILMKDCPDSISMLVVDKIVLQTMIAMIEASYDK